MYKLQPKTLFTGKNTVYLPSCHSTNETAAEIIQKNVLEEGTIVLTDNQTKGKGQRGNEWESEKGKNLTFTLVLRPDFLEVAHQFKLNMAVSLAVYQTFRQYLNGDLRIKWPNDIFFEDRKLGGILIESIVSGGKMTYSLIGIGLNINQNKFKVLQATSLSKESENEYYELEEVLERFSENFEKEYLFLKNGIDGNQKKRYLSKLFRIREWHKFKNEEGIFDGMIKDVSPTGKLIMETKFGLKQFVTKEFEYMY